MGLNRNGLLGITNLPPMQNINFGNLAPGNILVQIQITYGKEPLA
jgi:hypothetical protein